MMHYLVAERGILAKHLGQLARKGCPGNTAKVATVKIGLKWDVYRLRKHVYERSVGGRHREGLLLLMGYLSLKYLLTLTREDCQRQLGKT